MVVLDGGGLLGGWMPDHNSRSNNYHFLFLLPFDAEALETCKNTIKLINFVCSTLSWVGSLVDSDCVL